MHSSKQGKLYVCQVLHRRPGPPRYQFSYRSFYLLVDIDAIDAVCAATPLLSHNRFNLLSIHDVDFGPHDGSNLRCWMEALLAGQGVDLAGGRIQLLSMPRVLGYGFNPISIFYCSHADGSLRAIVAQVHNTFGEYHFYVLHEHGAAMDWNLDWWKSKQFHVSPFFSREGAYRFRFTQPAERFGVSIRLYSDMGEDPLLRIVTELSGRCIEINSRNVLSTTVRMPLLPLKVVAAIYWQALKLKLRGARFHRKPEPQQPNIS